MNHQEISGIPRGLDPGKYDNRILSVAKGLSQEREGPVILVTKDLNLRIKADVIGTMAENSQTDRVDYTELYAGSEEIQAHGDQIDHPCLDASSKGLTYLVERLKGDETTGHVTLFKGERSEVAEMGTRFL